MKKQPSGEIFTARGRLLIHVAMHPGATVKEMTDALFLTKRSIYEMVSGLQKADYLTTQRMPGSRRTFQYYITTHGLAQFRRAGEEEKTLRNFSGFRLDRYMFGSHYPSQVTDLYAVGQCPCCKHKQESRLIGRDLSVLPSTTTCPNCGVVFGPTQRDAEALNYALRRSEEER